MAPRKRGREEMESSDDSPDSSPVQRLRGMWEFANLMQYIYIFGEAVKIENDFSIEDLETECLKPGPSSFLSGIGLSLLKFVSSHRGLTPELFDEYTRRQYVAKAEHRNPFGVDEEPRKFDDFDVFTKIRVLVQLSQWTLSNPDRIRERMPESKDSEQINWRIEEVGYDREDRYYYILDDNRLYRRTHPLLPASQPSKPKANSKKARAAARASKRRRTRVSEQIANSVSDNSEAIVEDSNQEVGDDDFGGHKWECMAVGLTEYQRFLDSIAKSRDPNERALHQCISEKALPTILEAEEKEKKKQEKHEKELLALQKMATAKRSSRLEAKHQKEVEEQTLAEEQRKKQEAQDVARRDDERQRKLDEERRSRMMTRDQRLREREHKRILREEELASLSEENRKVEAGEARGSERHLKAEMERKKKDIAALQEEEQWFFDCAKCGVFGSNVDDGTHSIACERCSVWQHSSCLGVAKEDAEKDDFHFICQDCKQREADAKKPKIPTLKFHINSSSSPNSEKKAQGSEYDKPSQKRKIDKDKTGLPPIKKFKTVDDHRRRGIVPNNDGAKIKDQRAMHTPFLNASQPPPREGQSTSSTDQFFAGNALTLSKDINPAKAQGYSTGGQDNAKPTIATSTEPRAISKISDAHNSTPLSSNLYQYHNTFSASPVPGAAYPQYPETYENHRNGFTPYQDSFRYQTSGSKNSHQATNTQQTPMPPQSVASKQTHQIQGSVSSSANPYANSFERQVPSLQSNHKIPSSLQKGPSLSPPQHSLASSTNGFTAEEKSQHKSIQSFPHQTPQTFRANGCTDYNLSPHSALPAMGPQAASPTKHSSPVSSSLGPAPQSSPVMNQPPLPPTNIPSSPGYSPQKQTSLDPKPFPNTPTTTNKPILSPVSTIPQDFVQHPSLVPSKASTHDKSILASPSLERLDQSPQRLPDASLVHSGSSL